MSLMPSLCAALERVGGERLVMRAGERPHVLAGDRRHDVASAILSVNAVEALAASVHVACPIATPAAVATPEARPPSSTLRTVSAVSGPGVTITRAATPTNAHSAAIYTEVPLIDCWPRATR